MRDASGALEMRGEAEAEEADASEDEDDLQDAPESSPDPLDILDALEDPPPDSDTLEAGLVARSGDPLSYADAMGRSDATE